MNEMELKRLISRVVMEALRRERAAQAPPSRAQRPDEDNRTIVLIPGLTPFAQEAACELKKRYDGSVTVVTFGQEFLSDGIPCVEASTAGKDELLRMASAARRVILLAPTLEMIANIAEGRDGSLAEYLFLRAVLWGKQTAVFLDFEVGNNKRMLSVGRISGCMDALESAGVEWVFYRKKPEKAAAAAASLITEADVSQAFHAGKTEILLPAGAIITPLAKDAASELGVKLKAPEVS